MSIEYPTFTYNNESVIIKPGNQFTNKQLRSRLHQMDVDSINIDSKAQLVNLYESTLKDDRNKFKLFDRLKKDTEDYYLKTGISLNRQIPNPSKNESFNNPERSKVINLKYNSHSQNYEENNYNENNARKQEIKLKRPTRSSKNNNNNNSTNAFYSSGNYEQNNDDTYNNNEEDFKNNNYNNYNNNNYYNASNNQNSRNFQTHETGYSDLSHTNNYNNNFRKNKNDDYNNNYMEQEINYNNNNNKKIYTNNPSDDYNENLDNTNQNDNVRRTNDINCSENENMKVKEPDEQSNFSLFSGFSSFKNAKQISFHLLTGALVICLALGFYYLYRIFSEQINDFFSLIFDALTHPGQIASAGFGYLRAYWYIIPIILIFLIIIINLWKRYQFKKRCKEIMKKIVEDLRNEEGERVISEEDIYRKYVQQYGISWEKFKKRYLPLLAKMRSKNKNLKTFSEIVEGKNVVFWEFQE